MPRIGSISLSWNRENEVLTDFGYWPRGSMGQSPQRGHYAFSENGIIRGPANTPAIDCLELFQFARALSNSVYIGPFRNAINSGAAQYYGLSVGTEFIHVWHEWKTGENKAAAIAIERVTEDIRKIFGFRKLEIAASQRLNTLQIAVNGRPYKLRELGAGLAQFILVFGNAAFRKPDYIFIDEPELNLHPSLQVDFLTSLASYASEGIIFATHSLGLARTLGDRLYSLKKRDRRD